MKLKLLSKGSRTKSPSAVKRQEKGKGKLLVFLFIALVVFGLSIVLYETQYLLPKFSLNEGNILDPQVVVKNDTGVRRALSDNHIAFEDVKESSQSSTLTIRLDKDSYAYFDSSKDAESQAKMLSEILSRITIENKDKKIKYVDLRYDKPVVKF